jgi:hypothetical protein
MNVFLLVDLLQRCWRTARVYQAGVTFKRRLTLESQEDYHPWVESHVKWLLDSGGPLSPVVTKEALEALKRERFGQWSHWEVWMATRVPLGEPLFHTSFGETSDELFDKWAFHKACGIVSSAMAYALLGLMPHAQLVLGDPAAANAGSFRVVKVGVVSGYMVNTQAGFNAFTVYNGPGGRITNVLNSFHTQSHTMLLATVSSGETWLLDLSCAQFGDGITKTSQVSLGHYNWNTPMPAVPFPWGTFEPVSVKEYTYASVLSDLDVSMKGCFRMAAAWAAGEGAQAEMWGANDTLRAAFHALMDSADARL